MRQLCVIYINEQICPLKGCAAQKNPRFLLETRAQVKRRRIWALYDNTAAHCAAG